MTATSSSKSSVYDRLYKAGTASSKNRKEVAAVVQKNILTRENDEPPITKTAMRKSRASTQRVKKATKTTSTTNGEVFSRLYSKGTASSVSKRSGCVSDAASTRSPMKPKNQL